MSIKGQSCGECKYWCFTFLGVEDNFGYYMVELNDKKCLDFNQIADILERNYVVN